MRIIKWTMILLTVVVLSSFPIFKLSLAATIQNFDVPGTSYTLIKYYGSSAQVLSGGPSANFLRLAHAWVGQTLNVVAFDRTDAGLAAKIVADFDFRMFGGDRADGIGFALLNTAYYGTSGQGPQFWEEVNLTGSLGIGFDIYNNSEYGGNNHLSLHFNGGLLQNFPLNSSTQIDLWKSAEPNYDHARIVVDLLAGRVSVYLTPAGGAQFTAIDNYLVSGLAPYEARVAFSARTGGCHANHDIDNINVQFQPVPLPATLLLFGPGLLGVAGMRKRFGF